MNAYILDEDKKPKSSDSKFSQSLEDKNLTFDDKKSHHNSINANKKYDQSKNHSFNKISTFLENQSQFYKNENQGFLIDFPEFYKIDIL